MKHVHMKYFCQSMFFSATLADNEFAQFSKTLQTIYPL